MSGNGSFRAPPIEGLQPHFPQYKIEAFAAVGGMGAVCRATQINADRPVALKILPPEMATEESFRERFAMEAKAMARSSHRNLDQLYDFGETGGIFWMIQEWVEGRTTFEVMHEEERLDPREAAALVAQACEGLGYAHKQEIVRRMHFGAWSYPTVVPLGPNRCGISFRRNSYARNKQEIRFVVAGDLWGK
ncbi:MAG: protein kinase [Roseibacillus sp.]